MSIARDIRDQIGERALYLLGATRIVTTYDSLQFRINGSLRCNLVRVTLVFGDTYTLRFIRLGRGAEETLVAEHANVESNLIHRLIKKETGIRV